MILKFFKKKCRLIVVTIFFCGIFLVDVPVVSAMPCRLSTSVEEYISGASDIFVGIAGQMDANKVQPIKVLERLKGSSPNTVNYDWRPLAAQLYPPPLTGKETAGEVQRHQHEERVAEALREIGVAEVVGFPVGERMLFRMDHLPNGDLETIGLCGVSGAATLDLDNGKNNYWLEALRKEKEKRGSLESQK